MEENTQNQETKTEQETKSETKSEEFKNEKIWALLSYLGVLVLLPLLLKKDSAFVQFHAKQGLILLIGWAISWLPFGGIIALLVLIFSIIGIINVLNGEKKSLPVVGELAEKLNF